MALLVATGCGEAAEPQTSTTPLSPAFPSTFQERITTTTEHHGGGVNPDREATIQVIVDLPLPWQPEADLSEKEITAQREAIAAAQDEVLALLEGCPVEVVELYESTPQMALRVDAGGLERLEGSELVANVQIDQPDPSN